MTLRQTLNNNLMPSPRQSFSCLSVDVAAARMSKWNISPVEGYKGTIRIGNSIYRYECHIHPGGELTESWLNDRNLNEPNDERQLYIIPKGDIETTPEFNYTFGRRPGIVIGNRFINITHDGAIKVVGANLYPEGNGNSTLSGADGIAYAQSIRDKDWVLSRGEWEIVGGGSLYNPKVPGTGGAGAVGSTSIGGGATGTAGSSGGTGGGGAGGVTITNGTTTGAGDGAAGSTFSGGAGSGGCAASSDPGGFSAHGEPFGGSGGNAIGNVRSAGGGAGNPGGAGFDGSTSGAGTSHPGGNGAGGVLLVLGADLSGSGEFSVEGFAGGNTSTAINGAAGGASGGGSVTVAIAGSASAWHGTVSAQGGSGGDGTAQDGGDGGDGTARILNKLWSPLNLPNLVEWWDASYGLTLREDDGDKFVEEWMGRTGKSNTKAIQETTGNQPLLKIDSNGNPFLEFIRDNNNSLKTGTVDLTHTSQLTLIAVVEKNSNPTGRGTVMNFVDNGFNNFTLEVPRPSGGDFPNTRWLWVGSTTLRSLAHSLDLNTRVIYSGRADLATPIGNLRANGEDMGTSTDATGGGNYKSGPIAIGDYVAPTGRYFDGRIYQLLLFDRYLTDEEVLRIEEYLSPRVGVTLI